MLLQRDTSIPTLTSTCCLSTDVLCYLLMFGLCLYQRWVSSRIQPSMLFRHNTDLSLPTSQRRDSRPHARQSQEARSYCSLRCHLLYVPSLLSSVHSKHRLHSLTSAYNGKPTQLNNWFEVISNRLNIHGFLVLDYLSRAPEAVAALRKALEEGKLKHETKGETLVRTKSFEEVPLVWSKLFSGGNIGKLVTQVSDDI